MNNEIREKKYAVILGGLRLTDYMYDDVIQTSKTLYGIKNGMKDASVIHAYSKEDGRVVFKMEFVEDYSYTENIMTIKMNNQHWYVYFDSCQKVKGPFSKCRIDNNVVIVARTTERIVGNMKVQNIVYGMYNEDGKKVLPMKYEKILPKPEGLIEVRYKQKVGLLNDEGKWIVTPLYDEFEFYNLGSTLIECWSKYEDCYGLIDKNGNVIFPCSYFCFEIDDENFLIYACNSDELWGIYKLNGEMIFPEISPSLFATEQTIEVVLNRQTIVYIPILNLFLPREYIVYYKNYLKYFYNGKWRKLKYDKS